MSDHITIGIVIPYLKSRGTEKQALALAKGFLREKAKVVLFVIQGWGLDYMYEAFSQAGVKVVDVSSAVDLYQKKVRTKRIFKLAQLAQKHQCNILLSRAGMANKICGYAALLARIPSVVVASSAVSSPKPPSSNLIRGQLATLRWQSEFGFPSHIVTVSSESGENLRLAYPVLASRVTSIHNGVNLQAIRALSEQETSVTLPTDKFNLCYAGSVELKRKGIDVLIEAVSLLVNQHGQTDILLTIIGTGEDQKEAIALVHDYNLGDYISFAGEVKNPFGIIKQADVFILPSRREGLPNALLEAMALGICVISTDCDTGPREIIDNNVNGQLVPVEDSDGIAAAVLKIKKDRPLQARLAQQGRQTIEQSFSYQGMVDAYYDLLSQLSSTPSKAPIL